jgi:hypothetical protein
MNGGLTLKRKQSIAKITFQNHVLNILEKSRANGYKRNNYAQLEELLKRWRKPHKEDFFQSRIFG